MPVIGSLRGRNITLDVLIDLNVGNESYRSPPGESGGAADAILAAEVSADYRVAWPTDIYMTRSYRYVAKARMPHTP